MAIDLGLEGKSAVVVGVGPGIGRESARLLAEAGAFVFCLDINAEAARATSDALNAAGGVAAPFVADVLSRKDVREIFDIIADRQGGIDIMVNVVGIAGAKRFLDVNDEDWARQMDMNLRQQFIVAQETVFRMQGKGGSIIMIGTINAVRSSPSQVAYGAAKAGLISMARTIAVEHGGEKIRCNVVSPGVTLTPRIENYFDRMGNAEDFRAMIPLGRLGTAVEIGKTVLYLASDLASNVTGQTILCDGGWSINYPLPSLQALPPATPTA
ncbi:short-chain dehydrogenase/reductase SDR family protein (plasmid) [Rhizobium gallicum]|uniref:Short-chain dehydrogenase/reductase SDR family protein n=1 Tax=Rhizobium gallicum TaxID=56730 RepID=A0A1L5NS10_9HYPH|nr:SDR family oxidoreductase [Rhizobium gallicum]APO70683.1 short-chain dehydrogenase/reductase SDR family protein [Rhizobium gallicum]